MGYLALVATLVAGLPHGHGIIDMEAAVVGGRSQLLTGAFADGGIMRFELAEGRPARLVQAIARSAGSGTLGLSDLAVLEVGGTLYLAGAGRYADAPALRPFAAAGAGLGAAETARAARGDLSRLHRIHEAATGGRRLIALAGWDRPGLELFEARRDRSLRLVARLKDTRRRTMADISAIASARLGTTTFLFAASAGESGITAFRLPATGRARRTAITGAARGIGMAGTSALATVAIRARRFLVAAAAGSGTLTSFRITAAGRLRPVDHRIDSLDTRFAGVSALAAFAWQDRAFVVAGGSDDGLTLFELGLDGRLHLVEVIAQEAGWTLAGVQAVAAVVVGKEAQLFAAGAGAPGITQFRIDLARLGPAVRGGAAGEALAGGALDDLIEGGGGDDRLNGGAGDDRLVDGPGRDRLTGGPGADVFALVADGRRDRILDFEPGVDRLDLSAWPMLYDRSQIAVTATATGAILRHRDEEVVLRAASARPITAAELDAGHFRFD